MAVAPPTRYTTATSFLEHASTSDILTYTVPTNSVVDETAPAPLLNQADHALYSSTWYPPFSNTNGFVLSRVIEDAFTLELRWVSFTKTSTSTEKEQEEDGEESSGRRSNPFRELDQHPGTLAPVRFTFPSRLVPNPAFNVVSSASEEEDGQDAPQALQICALSEAGYLYALTFPLDTLFYSVGEDKSLHGSGEWSEEFKVEGLEGRIPVLLEGAQEGRVVIACSDGFTVVAEIAEGNDGALIETELRAPSSFSIRSLVPSFSRRDLSSTSSPLKFVSGSAHSSSSPSQLVSLAISLPTTDLEGNAQSMFPTPDSTFGFGVSRDRKLKVWNLETGNCLRSIDLPKPSSASPSTTIAPQSRRVSNTSSLYDPPMSDVSQHPKSQLLLSPSPQKFVKITSANASSSVYGSYLTLYTPPSGNSNGTFFVYGLATDPASGELSQLAPVAERTLAGMSDGDIQMVDFELKRMGLAGDERWNLWTLSESGGESAVAVCGLSELEEGEIEEDIEVDKDDWVVVSQGGGGKSSTLEWTAGYFDQQLQSLPNLTVAEIFLQHISTPGRYPPASFDYALDLYEEMVLGDFEQKGLQPPFALEQEYDSNLIRSAAVVGCHIELEYSGQTGAPLEEDFTKKIKLEWLRFVALLNESRSAALFPTVLSVDEARGLAFVVGRDSMSMPVKEEIVQTLHQELLSTRSTSLNLASMFPQYPQSNFIPLIGLIKSTLARLSLGESRTFEGTLLDRIRRPFKSDIEDISLELFEQTLEPALSQEALAQVLAGLGSFIEPSKTIESFCQLLLASIPGSSIPEDGHCEPSDLANSVLADLLTTGIQARYDLAKGLVLLLIAAWGASDEEGAEPAMASFEQTTSLALATLHSISTLQWTATQIAYPSHEDVELVRKVSTVEDGDALLDRFGALKVGEASNGRGAEVLPVPTYSLLNALLRIPSFAPYLASSTYAALPNSLADCAAVFLASTGLLSAKPLIDSTDNDAKFAFALHQFGMNEQVKNLLAGYPQDAAMTYVEGRADLELGHGDIATRNFERAASGMLSRDSVIDELPFSACGLRSILPSKVDSLSAYYIHLVSLFVPTSFETSIARFAQLALDALDEEADGGEVDETVATDLWTKLFRSWAAVGEYQKAYQAIMATPYHETKTTCLAHFISLVCENGATSLLTTLSFVGLEGDLERNLAFRARNSEPLAQPDYYKILYAYHVSKGDYRSAGTVMYQQARRIGEIAARGGSFRDLATIQCQSYLAATNALSLVSKDHAWVAIVADESLERGNKRRKVNYHIPDDEYDPSASRPLELRELADIRREYTVALARLQLSAEFPELERTNFHLEPEAVVALFSQTNAFDQAFNAGRSLNVDLSSLFEIIAEKCVSLTLHPDGVEDASWVNLSPEAATWEGSLPTKAWKLLEHHLQRHDVAPVYRYRLVVLERVLATNRDGKIPSPLTDFLLKHQPQSLVRILIRFDRLDEAFRYSIKTIQNSTLPKSNFGSTLPYALFDQLLSIPSGDSPNLSDDVLKQRQQELRHAVEDRKRKVENAGAALRR